MAKYPIGPSGFPTVPQPLSQREANALRHRAKLLLASIADAEKREKKARQDREWARRGAAMSFIREPAPQ